MTSSPEYELIYHAGIPGRGEFIRLFFEATGTPYKDSALVEGQSAIEPYLNGTFEGRDKNPVPFAPPILKHGDVVISQTSNILFYLATHLDSPIDLSTSPSSDPSPSKKLKPSPRSLQDSHLYHVNALALTILDLNNETHDTHHPISVSSYYEDQKEAAIERAKDFRKNRVPKFFNHFESVLEKGGGEWLVGSEPSYADLCLFQVVDGLKFAFPNFISKELPNYPKISAHWERVKSAQKIKSYLESDRRQKYSMGVFRHYEELDEPHN
ncbi:glutathione S-transferase [Sporobolomyces salmoneus]|uniref:glutathione S-transferase n=1 Tax=Sporobolomyces salmoneus TaxID=183962 RepID=UPI00317265EA